VNTVLGRILFVVAFHQLRFSCEVAFPLGLLCLCSGDRLTKLCRLALRDQSSTKQELDRMPCCSLHWSRACAESFAMQKRVGLRPLVIDAACLTEILAWKDAFSKNYAAQRVDIRDRLVSPIGLRDICLEHLKPSPPI